VSRPAPVRWLKAHPFAADVIFAGLVGVVSLSAWVASTNDLSKADLKSYHPINALGFILVLCQVVPLVWRRRAPVPALLIIMPATVLFFAYNFMPAAGGIGALLITYSVAAHVERKRSLQALAFVYTCLLISLALSARYQRLHPGDLVAIMVEFTTAWVLGDNLRTRRAYTASVEERAATLEQQQRDNASRAVNEERARIARELHDVVAHSVSVMVVQAGAARRVLRRDPDRAADALSSIETSGRQALDELRRLLAMLRQYGDAAPALAPQPTDLEPLLAQVEEAGLPVTMIVDGEPRALPTGVSLSVYRIVQEALTNAITHAGPAHAVVRLRYLPEDLIVTVTDDGRGLAEELGNGDRTSPRHGLIGMAERVALFGGDLRAGPKPGGGYEVEARLSLNPTHA
jgi:signal transduction histidine kinase